VITAVSTTSSLLDFIGRNADPWGYVAVFVVAALESSAFTGLVIPGETLLLFAGFLAWRGDLNLVLTMAMAFVGAVVGDSIGYEIGRHLGGSVRASRVGRWVGRDRWDRARNYLREKGGKAVMLGRFVAVVRALVPAAAGDARLRYRTFLAWNVAGALPWAILHVGLGYVAGDSYHVVERYLGRASAAALVLVAAVAVTVIVVRHRRQRATRD
jgi:membrane protein DedA with SNARE-associated domain